MSTKALTARASSAIFLVVFMAGCQHSQHTYRNIALEGFSERNYVALNRNLETPVCVLGRISIDSAHGGVYFPLHPGSDGNTVTIGFSRVISGLSDDYARRNMVDGGNYRVCGTLRDATPFRRCDHDRCRWYKLEDGELR